MELFFMNKIFFLFIIFAIFSPIYGIVTETASFSEFLYGETEECEYDNWLSHVSEGIASEDYNLYAPWERQTNGFGNFYLATNDTLDLWEQVITEFLDGEYEQAQNLINNYQFPYQVVEFNDTDTGRTYYILREILNMEYYDNNGTIEPYDDEVGSFDFGWGLFVYNPQSSIPIIVNVVHPNDDFIVSAVAHKCFVEWNAMFLTISGVGREVKWTEVGSYANSKSLSDPSRREVHAYNTVYQAFCDKIRQDFGRREFSPQIHSYDWNRHYGYANCQISAGYNKGCPNLPMRDLSDLHLDFVNASTHIIHPANSTGNNSAVYLNDFYAVNYDIYEFMFYSETGRHYSVNNELDLEGYSQNKQMLYTFDSWNRYDVFEPFYHLEMDEFPNCYPETEEEYKLFYGFNPDTGFFDMAQLFNRTLEFYAPWLDAMTEILPETIELNDQLTPNTPQNLIITNQTFNSIALMWEPISCFDFYTYEIIYADEPITGVNYSVYNRNNNYLLASPREISAEINNLALNTQYHFKVRALDYNDNYSLLSEEITAYTAPAIIDEFAAYGNDNYSLLEWTAQQQDGNQGFNVYRRISEGEYILIDSWQTNPSLQGSSQPNTNYQYVDNGVDNGQYYYYQLSSVNSVGMEFFHNDIVYCYPAAVFELYVSSLNITIMDTVAFSMNPFATDEFDYYFDIEKSDPPLFDFIYAAFYEEEWQSRNMYLAKETHGNYDTNYYFKTWELHVATDQFNEILEISLSPDYYPEYGKLYIEDNQTGQFVKLTETNMNFTIYNSAPLFFTLYWGDLKPEVLFAGNPNQIYKSGDEINIDWTLSYVNLVESLDISIQNDEDSILVASQVDPGTNHITWIVPDDITLHNGEVYIDVSTFDNEIVRAISNYSLGIVPETNTISWDEGWQMAANPWVLEFNLPVQHVFGPDAELFISLPQNQYQSVDQFEFEQGYWLDAPTAGEYSNSGNIQKTTYDIPMIPGWNLLPNPHLCNYQPKDLLFGFNGNVHSFSYMYSHQYISYAFFQYEDSSYKIAEIIDATSSFYVYANVDSGDTLSCKFTPYNSAYYNPGHEKDWILNFTASQFDSDKMTIGVSRFASNDFDFRMDLPEPPHKPFEEGIELYFPKDLTVDTLFIYDRLHQEIKLPMSATLPEVKTWDFALKINLPDAVTLEMDLSELPDGYHASISIDGNSWNELVSGNYIYSFSPTQIDTLQGQITITNELWTSTDEIVTFRPELINYPNPFNPDTNIRFNIASETDVELSIYNIKGQKVRTLCKQKLESGNYEYTWKGRDNSNKVAASGIYFIRLKTNGSKRTRKILLLK